LILSASSATMKLIVLSSIALLAAVNADDWSYLCLGMKHGCVLAQKEGSEGGVDGFYTTLKACEDKCPMIGKDLSWECTATGNCLVAAQPPNPSSGFFPSHAACALAPGGKCFAPGNMTISYECHGTHFGCVPKSEKADEKTKFANVDDCEAKCHIVPTGMSFGCSGSRPTGCVLLNTPPNPPSKYFAGIEECNTWCQA